MTGHRNFKELRRRIEADAERKTRMEERRKAYDAVLSLAEARESCGVTQERLAREMGVTQPDVSKLEKSRDPHLSSLRHYAEALGGHLEVNVVLPDHRTIELLPPDVREKDTSASRGV